MDENITNGFSEAGEESDLFLPEGWTAEMELFDGSFQGEETEPAGGQTGASSPEETVPAEGPAEPPASTTDGDVPAGPETGSAGSAPRTTGADRSGAGTLKFSAVIDHARQEVELPESQLPDLYQKAQVTERVQSRLRQIAPAYRRVEDTARELGYESVDQMLEGLRGGGAAPERERGEEDGSAPEKGAGRDYRGELTALKARYPDLRQVPDQVVLDSNGPLTESYARYEARQRQAELQALRLENQRLRANADAASRAPVRGVSGGGATDTRPEDPFIRGFEADEW